MSKKALMLIGIVLVFSASNLQSAQIASTWVGGEWGQWGHASNWNPAIVPDNTPTQTFAVTIDSNSIGVNEVEVVLQQNRTVDRLDCYGDVDLEQWTTDWIKLAAVTGLANHGTLDIDINIDADVTNTTKAKLDMENAGIKGNLFNAAEGIVFVVWDVEIVDGTIENDGFMFVCNWADIWADYQFRNSGRIRLYNGQCSSDEVFDNNSAGIIEGSGGIHSDELVKNDGTIYASGGSLTLQSFGSIVNTSTGTLGNRVGATLHIAHIGASVFDVNNQGTIESYSSGAVTFDGDLINEPNATIDLLGGTLAATTITQTADANFAGFGGIAGNLIIESNGEIKLTGPTNIVGDVEIRENATLEISDGTMLVTGQTTCNGTIHLKGGRIIPQGGLSGDCNIIWEPGLYTNIADFNLDGKVNIKDFVLFADTWLWHTAWY